MTDEELKRLREKAQQATIQTPTLSTDNGIKEGSTFGQPEVQGQTFNAPLQTTTETPQSEVDKVLAAYEKRQKVDDALDARSRSGSIVGGIADMARSLANLYYTTKGSPNAFDPTQGMTERQREMYEKAKADRDARRNEWMHYALNVAGRKDAAAQAAQTREDLNNYRQQQLEIQQRKADDAAKLAAQKEEDKAIKNYADTYGPLFRSWARDGKENDLEEERKELKRRFEAGEISEYVYNGMDAAITKAINSVKDKNSQTDYNNTHRTTGSGSSSSKVDVFSTPLGNVAWPKTLTGKTYPQNLRRAYNTMLSINEKYKSYATEPDVKQMEWSIEKFFADPEISIEQKKQFYNNLQNIGRGVATQTTSSNGKRDWNDNGKKNW